MNIHYISRDDKNKIKVGSLGELSALAQKRRVLKVLIKLDLSVADYILCIETYLTLLVIANIQYSTNKSSALSNFCDLKQ